MAINPEMAKWLTGCFTVSCIIVAALLAVAVIIIELILSKSPAPR